MLSVTQLSVAADSIECVIDIVSSLPALPPPARIALLIAKIPYVIFKGLKCVSTSLDIHNERSFYHIVRSALTQCTHAASQEAKAKALAQVLRELDDNDKRVAVGTRLSFSTAGQSALQERVNRLHNHISTRTISDIDIEFVRILATRTRQHLITALIDTVNDCVGIAAGIIGMTPMPVAARLISTMLFAACATTSLATWIIRELFPRSTIGPGLDNRPPLGFNYFIL